MTRTTFDHALCIGCNYQLRDLALNRCPECGREFDPMDQRTFTLRPLTWFDHLLRKPIGAPTFIFVVVLCAAVLWVALDPSIYYMIFHWFLLFGLWVAVSIMLGVRRMLREATLPTTLPRDIGRRRIKAIYLIVSVTTVLVSLHVPLRIEFLLVRKELEQWVQEIKCGTDRTPKAPRRIGPFVLLRAGYGGSKDGELFFCFQSDNGSGFAYFQGTTSLDDYYNAGADGHLFGPWYWWTDD